MSKTKPALTPAQLETIRWTASLGASTAEALALRLGVSVGSARGRLTALSRRGLLARKRLLTEQPALYTVTRLGLRTCEIRGLNPCQVKERSANHLIVCAAVAAALERRYPGHRLIGECELRRDEREQGGQLASAQLGFTPAGALRLHRPDLVLWPNVEVTRTPREEAALQPSCCDRGAPIAVEVELTVKAADCLLGICRGWARCRTIAGVLYVVTPTVAPALARAIAKTRASQRIFVVPLEALQGAQ